MTFELIRLMNCGIFIDARDIGNIQHHFPKELDRIQMRTRCANCALFQIASSIFRVERVDLRLSSTFIYFVTQNSPKCQKMRNFWVSRQIFRGFKVRSTRISNLPFKPHSSFGHLKYVDSVFAQNFGPIFVEMKVHSTRTSKPPN